MDVALVWFYPLIASFSIILALQMRIYTTKPSSFELGEEQKLENAKLGLC